MSLPKFAIDQDIDAGYLYYDPACKRWFLKVTLPPTSYSVDYDDINSDIVNNEISNNLNEVD